MLRLGLEEALVGAGGGWVSSLISYDEGVDPAQADASPVPMGFLVSGVAGSFHVGHPQAGEALNALAAARAATVVRGVGEVTAAAGAAPRVQYELDGVVHEVRCRLVVGADGRQSSVRRGLGFPMHYQESDYVLGGLLVRGAGLPEASCSGTEGEVHFSMLAGPETAPAEVFEPGNIERILALR